jgi:hypothetical protein
VIEAGGIRSYSARLPAHHHLREIFGGSFCSKTDILVLSGRDTTNSAGVATLSLNSLLCGVVNEGLTGNMIFTIIREPNFVVTPRGSLPSFATVVNHSTSRQLNNEFMRDRDNNPLRNTRILDVTVDIRTWKHDGSPAAKTLFSWICTVEAARLTDMGG